MANIKITDLTAYGDPASTDVLPIVDVGADVTKKVSIADLLENAGSGTASAPGIAFDGDSNTGIYRPGADQLAFATNGTERARITSSGRLGIATSSPDTLLRVGDTIGCVTSDVFSIFKNGSSTGYDFLSVSIGTSNTSHGVAYIDISHGGQVSGVGTQHSLTRWKIIKAAGSAAVVTNLDATESFASMITASVADNVVTFRAATASNSTNAFNGRFAIFCTGTALTTATSVAVAFARL